MVNMFYCSVARVSDHSSVKSRRARTASKH